MLKIGVIGCGAMGEVHAQHIHHKVQAANLAGIMDTDASRLQSLSRDCGNCPTFTDAEALIQHARVDAVIIASPDQTHANLALSCLAAGKPVLCEKPLATDECAGKAVLDAETALNRRLLQVGFMREYDLLHLSLREALAQPGLGSKLMFRSRAVNPSKDQERPVDEVVTNSAIHDIHTARWLMGEEIERVFAQHIPYHPDRPGTCRLMNICLYFTSGALGTLLINSECGYGHEVEVEITTERAQLNIGEPGEPILRQGAQQAKAVLPDWRQRFKEAYLREVTQWVAAVTDGPPEGPSAWDGYCSLAVSDAIKKSLRTGRVEAVPLIKQPALYTQG